jgi:hypothetical protein
VGGLLHFVLMRRPAVPPRERAALTTSMPEMPLPREHHDHPSFLRRGDDFRIAHGSSRLDDGADSGVGEEVEAVAKGKKASDAAKVPMGQDRFHDRDFRSVDGYP